jgi:phytoene desaturase
MDLPDPNLNTGPSRRAAVVGGGVGGLSAAIHLRARGWDVDLFEANDRFGGRANLIEAADFRFDTGPSLLNYPWVFEDLFAAAGRRMSDYVELLPVDPSISFLWPDGARFTLSSDLARLARECERWEPGCTPRLLAYLADAECKYNFSMRRLVPSNETNPLKWFGALRPREMARLSVWRTLYGELHHYFRHPRLCQALASYGMYLGGSPWQLPGLFSILPFGELAYGLWLPKGGIHGLVEGLVRLARDTGVRLTANRRVARIRTAGARVTGLEFADGTAGEWTVVVSNVDVPTTRGALLEEPAGTRRAPPMTPGVITFYIGLRGRVDHLSHHTIFLPDDYRGAFDELTGRHRIPKALPFYVSVPSATDPSLAPPGHTALFALAPTPVLSRLGDIDWTEAVRDVRDRMFGRLAAHGTPIDPRDIVFETVFTPVDWRDRFGLHDGSAFGAVHTLFELGPFRTQNRDPKVRGLYYVGASTTPGTGLPLVAIGGAMTARRVDGGEAS